MSDSPTVDVVVNPYISIQRAVVRALRADEVIASKAKVYDYVPENEDGPYIVFQSAWIAARDALNTWIDRVWFQLDVWAQYRGFELVNEIGDDIERVLRRAQLDVDGFNTRRGVHIEREQSHLLREPMNMWRRLAMTFVCPYVRPMNQPLGR